MTLRTRLALAAAAAAALAVTGVAVLGITFARYELRNQVDHSLQRQAQNVKAAAVVAQQSPHPYLVNRFDNGPAHGLCLLLGQCFGRACAGHYDARRAVDESQLGLVAARLKGLRPSRMLRVGWVERVRRRGAGGHGLVS